MRSQIPSTDRGSRSAPPSRGLAALLAVLLASGCTVFGYPGGAAPTAPVGGEGGPPPEAATRGGSYEVAGRRYHVMSSAEGYRQVGIASWYGPQFHGLPTANGETFDQNGLTAAHRSLPLGTRVRVTVLETGRSVVVRVNDRGPFADTGRRIIDVSRGAARELGILGVGTAEVEVRALSPHDSDSEHP